MLAAIESTSEAVTAAAAFLSGIGSVLTGYLALRYERKRGIEDCNNRLAALHEGMVLRDRVERGQGLTEEDE